MPRKELGSIGVVGLGNQSVQSGTIDNGGVVAGELVEGQSLTDLHLNQLQQLLERIVEGKGQDGDIEKLEELAQSIKTTALCGLGQTAPNPVLSTLKYYRHEYEAHIYEHRCPAGQCKALLNYKIDPDKCKGCTLCARNCPANCISGKVREPHVIDNSKCLKCGACMEKCKFGAITKG